MKLLFRVICKVLLTTLCLFLFFYAVATICSWYISEAAHSPIEWAFALTWGVVSVAGVIFGGIWVFGDV